jgi:hypothetical protein
MQTPNCWWQRIIGFLSEFERHLYFDEINAEDWPASIERIIVQTNKTFCATAF